MERLGDTRESLFSFSLFFPLSVRPSFPLLPKGPYLSKYPCYSEITVAGASESMTEAW